MKENNSYRSILKGTSIFGGMQVFQIFINLIRGKFVAMFLGPVGMGISSLFNSSGLTIQQIASLGLNLGIVKEVANKKDSETFPALLHTSKLLIWASALLGAIVCMALAVPLSRLTFGTADYSWQFVLLGSMILFSVAGQGYVSILQGMHAVKLVSATTIAGSLAGLLIGVPLYYFWGVKGIVPAMVILALSFFIASWIGVRKAVEMPRLKLNFNKAVHGPIAKKLLLLGVVLMSTNVMTTAATYLINLFIRNFGDMENVGLFQAANSVTNQYSGVVFTAMLFDFFPRLSEVAGNNSGVRKIVNRQLEIISLIATPLLCLLIVFAPIVISVLLTEEFQSILPLMRWLSLGVLIKALMMPMGYIAFAKDNKSLVFWLEGVYCNLQFLVLSCLFYYLYGLIGLGISLVIDCSLCFIIYYVVNRRLYNYKFSAKATNEAAFAILLGAGCFSCSLLENQFWAYLMMAIVTAVAITRSAVLLKRRLR